VVKILYALIRTVDVPRHPTACNNINLRPTPRWSKRSSLLPDFRITRYTRNHGLLPFNTLRFAPNHRQIQVIVSASVVTKSPYRLHIRLHRYPQATIATTLLRLTHIIFRRSHSPCTTENTEKKLINRISSAHSYDKQPLSACLYRTSCGFERDYPGSVYPLLGFSCHVLRFSA
jgi:hypothetical protein